MAFLKLLEGIRFGPLNWLMQLITFLGEETVFMVVAILIFWCVDKWKGYFILSVGFIGTIFNQFLKLVFRIPRPWVKDPDFTIVKSAKEGASGYSFPSGHTQNAVGTYGGIARFTKRRWLRIVCLVLVALIGFSRMYLGAHYPSDVLVALGIGIALVLIMYPILRRAEESPRVMYGFLAVMTVIAVGYLLFVKLWKFPADIDRDNYHSGLKNAYTLLGCLLGMIVDYTVDLKKLHFEVKAPLLGQILKVVLGLAGVMAIRLGLSWLLGKISDALFWNAIRYFCMVVFAGTVWPLTFPLWQKVGAKKAPAPVGTEDETARQA